MRDADFDLVVREGFWCGASQSEGAGRTRARRRGGRGPVWLSMTPKVLEARNTISPESKARSHRKEGGARALSRSSPFALLPCL